MKKDNEINPALRPPGEDRRKWVRYPMRLTGLCRVADIDNGSTWIAQIQNISHEGLKMLCRRPLERGIKILISPSNPSVLPRIARVVHVISGAEGNWIIGCVFTRELLDEGELLTWIKSQNGKRAPGDAH
jgi:hypothetical protein